MYPLKTQLRVILELVLLLIVKVKERWVMGDTKTEIVLYFLYLFAPDRFGVERGGECGMKLWIFG